MARPRREDKPLALILVKRAAIFLFVICLVSLFYWIVGSESSFLDSTQSMLLAIMRISSLGIVVASGLGILLSLALARGPSLSPRAPRHPRLPLRSPPWPRPLSALAQSVTFLSRGLALDPLSARPIYSRACKSEFATLPPRRGSST